MDKNSLTEKFINGELHAEDLIDIIVEQTKTIEEYEYKLTEIENAMYQCARCGITVIDERE